MDELELKLAALNYLLSKTNFYEKLIHNKRYHKLSTQKYRRSFNSLRNSLDFEINQILEQLKANGVEHPKDNLSFKEVKRYLADATEFELFLDCLKKIYEEISRESESLEVDIIGNFDILPEWLFPTSTASVISDLDIIKSSVAYEYLNVDELFINTLMSNERVKNTLNFWKKQSKILKRLPIIEEAIEAHLEGKFILSVSALVPQVEGLLRDALQSMGRNDDFGSMRKEDMHRSANALKDLWKSQPDNLPKAESLLYSLPDAVSDLYEEYNPNRNDSGIVPGKLYRHGVCHGLQSDFGTKKNSLRLILLLDRIIFFYTST